MSKKFLGGVIIAFTALVVGALAFGVFEEANDGPIEDAVEAVDDAVK